MAIWTFLDLIFSFIDALFQNLFSAIPLEAIPFLIGIFCYSVIAFIMFFTEIAPEGADIIILKIYYKVFSVIMVLFTTWRFGFIIALDYAYAQASLFNIITWTVNIVYILIGLVLFYAFYRKNASGLRKLIIIVLWTFFLVITFIIVPALEWSYSSNTLALSTISPDTLVQVLIVAAIFATPRGLSKWKDIKSGGVRD